MTRFTTTRTTASRVAAGFGALGAELRKGVQIDTHVRSGLRAFKAEIHKGIEESRQDHKLDIQAASWCDLLNRARAERGMSLDKLARKTEISRSQLGLWEVRPGFSHMDAPTEDQVLAIQKVLNLTDESVAPFRPVDRGRTMRVVACS